MYNSHDFFFDTEMSLLVAKLSNVRLRQMSENYFDTTSVSKQLSLVTPPIGQKISDNNGESPVVWYNHAILSFPR